MPRFAAALSLFFSIVLIGCGSTPTPISTPAVRTVSGNWIMVQTSIAPAPVPSVPSGPVSGFVGALSSTTGVVTGTLNVLAINATDPGQPCVLPFSNLVVAGTLDTAQKLSLSGPLAGGTVSLSVTLSADLHTHSDGTYSITGGSCAMAATPVSLEQIAPATGTYAGTLLLLQQGTSHVDPQHTAAVTVTLVQSSDADTDGHFPVTGNLVAAGTCPGKVSNLSGRVSGPSLLLQSPTAIFTNPGEVAAIIHPDASSLFATAFFASPCPGAAFQGTLTRQ